MSGAPMSLPRQLAATRRFTLGAPRNISITPDGATIHFLRSKHGRDPMLCLWAHDIASSTERLLVDPTAISDGDESLSAAERARRERARESAAGIVRYSIDGAGRRAVMEVGGSIVVADLSDGSLDVLPAADGLFDARIDPTGQRCAYVADRALRVIDLATGNDRVLAVDNDPLVSWGRADFIAAEEMGRSRGFWWNPDGTSLLATRVDDSAVPQWFIADPAQPGTVPNEIRYPAAGTTNPSVTLAELSLDGAASTIDWGRGDTPFEYLADVIWSDGRAPLVVRQPRDQRVVSIAEVDRSDGSVGEIQRITDGTWVELIPGSPTWSSAGLLTVEDRADLDRRVLCLDGTPVTGDDVHVKSVVAVDGNEVVITAWTDATEVHVGIVDLDAPGAAVRLLSDGVGVHGATAASTSAGRVVVVQSHRIDDPRPTATVLVADELASTLEVRTETPSLTTTPTFVTLGPRQLNSAVLLPSDHDGTSTLPVLLDPYGGPHAQRVLANNASHLSSQWFAEQGFAVIVTDNRGAPGRGPAFEREVWGDLASPVLEDQIDALDAAAEQYPFLDLDRVGIRGWSFGGYLAALAVLRRPDRFHAAVAGAPVTDWRLYDTHYTERYLGHPTTHPTHYDTTDLTAEAAQLERPLLLVHGLADDNVVAAHTLQLSSALLAAGRPHAVLPLSGVTHMTPQEVVAENLLHLQRDFLREHLAAGDGNVDSAP